MRVGLQPHHEVKHITLDALLEQRLAASASSQVGGPSPGNASSSS